MTKSDTLYKRTRTGTIQFWEVKVWDYDQPVIEKNSGKVGTLKPLSHQETITEGKQGRTSLQQALFMAESDFKKKKDEGYKTLEDLGVKFNGQFYNHPKTNSYADVADILEELLPKFNTDASGRIKPMLAPNKCWEANGKTKYPVQGETKLDGLRSHIEMTPETTLVLSRSGKVYAKMTHLIEVIDQVFPKSTRTKKFILDGELYKHGLSLQQMNKAIRGENTHTDSMQFWIYDLPTVAQKQSVRSAMIPGIISKIDNSLFQHDAPVILNSDAEVLVYHDKKAAEGFEGLILKDIEGEYEPGQRSPFWKKVKVFEDNEFEVIGYKLGQRGIQDLMFTCKCEAGEFEAVMNGTIEEKEELFAEIDTLIGKQLTVRHFGYTEYGIPNLSKGKAFREEGE